MRGIDNAPVTLVAGVDTDHTGLRGEGEQMIDSFRGKYHFLSNTFVYPIVWEQIKYNSVEYAYQAGKSLDMGVRQHISSLPNFKIAKRYAHTIQLRPNWDAMVRFQVMRELLEIKFAPNSPLTPLLMDTGTQLLTEGNMWHDNWWGDCHCQKRSECHQAGWNHLGVMLMDIRYNLLNP